MIVECICFSNMGLVKLLSQKNLPNNLSLRIVSAKQKWCCLFARSTSIKITQKLYLWLMENQCVLQWFCIREIPTQSCDIAYVNFMLSITVQLLLIIYTTISEDIITRLYNRISVLTITWMLISSNVK